MSVAYDGIFGGSCPFLRLTQVLFTRLMHVDVLAASPLSLTTCCRQLNPEFHCSCYRLRYSLPPAIGSRPDWVLVIAAR